MSEQNINIILIQYSEKLFGLLDKIACSSTSLCLFLFIRDFTVNSHVTSISENEKNIQISLCNVRHVNGMLNISLEIRFRKRHINIKKKILNAVM